MASGCWNAAVSAGVGGAWDGGAAEHGLRWPGGNGRPPQYSVGTCVVPQPATLEQDQLWHLYWQGSDLPVWLNGDECEVCAEPVLNQMSWLSLRTGRLGSRARCRCPLLQDQQ